MQASRVTRGLVALPLVGCAALICLVGSIAVFFGGSASGCGTDGPLSDQVPRRLVPLYQQASVRYGLGVRGPSILASINFHETDFGRNLGVSSAEAEGWMQFLPSSWEAFGVDANGDGRKDPYNPADAIFAAAHLLHSAGAPGDWHVAIFSYNHADWYVNEVLRDARRFAVSGAPQTATACAAVAPTEALARMLAEADRIDRLHFTYVWGGSHGQSPTPANGPFDCSSAVSHLLQTGGFGNSTMDTIGLSSWGQPGPGRLLTIYVKPYGREAHTFVEFAPSLTPPAERYWGTSGTNPGGGPGWVPESAFSAGYLAGFQHRHPPGF
jgi:Transglycosylase SLT domain